MFDRIQRDRFWLVLGAVLIGLFVVQKERGLVDTGPQQRQETRVYDRGGMTRLVEKAIEVPAVAPLPTARCVRVDLVRMCFSPRIALIQVLGL